MMNIVYSSSDSYAEICGISLLSCLENNKEEDEIRVFIVDNNISEDNKNKLIEICEEYQRNLVFIPRIDLDAITHTKVYTGRWNIGTFFRLFLGSLLPSSVQRVIYIDCDTIIRHSLHNIYNLDFEGFVIAGVDDCRSDLYRIEIGEKPGDAYINNGFMVIDLQKWRQMNLEQQFSEFITAHDGDITYMDQGVSNSILGAMGLIKELPPIYNSQRIFFDFNFKQLLKLRKPEHHCSEEEYESAIKDPIVVHFTPVFISGTRPWQVKDNHPFTIEYRKYKSLSPWKDVPYRKDDRKFVKKAMTILCKIMPRPLMIKIMSYLHASWYPRKRMKIDVKNQKLKYESFTGK